MFRGVDATNKINTGVDPIAKARMLQECERLSVKGKVVKLRELLSSYGYTLPALSEEVEREIAARHANGKTHLNGIAHKRKALKNHA